MSDWTNGKPFTWTEEMSQLPWGGHYGAKAMKHVSCGLCDRRPEPGDTWRWVHSTFTERAPNIFVCQACDSPGVSARWSYRWHDVIVPILHRWGHRYVRED